MAPLRNYPFEDAFKPEFGEAAPPGPTLLLPDSIRIVLVPTIDSTVPQFDFTTITSLPPTTLIELRTAPTTQYISFPVHPSTNLSSLQDSTFHCSNLFDLLLIRARLTLSQLTHIHVLKIRYSTALAILWEVEHPSHASHVSSSALSALSGLEKMVVDCEDRESWQVKNTKKELEECFEQFGIGVEMVGGKEGRGIWGVCTGWGFGGLGLGG